MKPGRNDPCSCGSGKKYKRCCMDNKLKQRTEAFDEVKEFVEMNPDLSIDELNAALQTKMQDKNNQPHPDFQGLSPNQIFNWSYAPLSELKGVRIRTPEDLSASPVMRYLALILDEAMKNNGSFKGTAKGNLPTKLVKQATDLLPEFCVSEYERYTDMKFSEFAGNNEDKFHALHYTRVLAEFAGIIYRRSGCYHVKKSAQKEYEKKGIQAFFIPMLEAVTDQYNWAYFDRLLHEVDFRPFWLFMLWRLQSHADINQLVDDMETAFPTLLFDFEPSDYSTPKRSLKQMIELRFIQRFLEFWGFVRMESHFFFSPEEAEKKVKIHPLFKETFEFSI